MIETVRDGAVLSVKVQGRIDGSNANDFHGEVNAAVTEEDIAVIMDMEQLTYISSAGLRVVLMLAKALEQRQASFMICSLSGAIREVFEISGFDKVISVHDSPQQALAAIGN
ncbi:STAS domain-containing protein [Candidatus Rariloculus sp.]|uniref:STAS domain-containing protein n=1 Tax=Candidatus Rariloculus sp. TaxID=3101265 RepID=UPI003D0B57F3